MVGHGTPLHGQAKSPLRLGGIYLELAKARLSALVVVTTLVGFLVALEGPALWGVLIWTVLGTALTAGGANAINHWMEVKLDSRMKRTRGRPLPTGRIGRRHALLFGVTAGALGPAFLACKVNLLAAGLALFAGLLYTLAYTPLKRRNSLCTLVGAVVGALPPMIGWAAATGGIHFGAVILGCTLFVWQVPHSLSLAWLCRDDYARGGFQMLPVVDPSGRSTFRMVVLYSLALLPIGLAALLAGMAGWIYAAGAFLLGAAMLALGVQLHLGQADSSARRLFLASLLYLPLLLGLMVLDRGPVTGGYLSKAVPAGPVGREGPSEPIECFADPRPQ